MNEYDGDAFDEAFMKPWLALEKKLAQLGKTIQFDGGMIQSRVQLGSVVKAGQRLYQLLIFNKDGEFPS
jgi:hypothetical protein